MRRRTKLVEKVKILIKKTIAREEPADTEFKLRVRHRVLLLANVLKREENRTNFERSSQMTQGTDGDSGQSDPVTSSVKLSSSSSSASAMASLCDCRECGCVRVWVDKQKTSTNRPPK